MIDQKGDFAVLFKKLRLKSGFATLAEFGDALAQEGLVYENSLFSHWQKGDRVPKDRGLLISILSIFVKRGGISRVDEANSLLASVGQRDLNLQELTLFSKNLSGETLFTVPDESRYFIGREKYLKEVSWNLLNKKPISVYGEAGVGKTYLAIKIAHTLKDKFRGGVLWHRFDIKGAENILNNIARVFGEDISRIKDKKIKSEIVRDLLTKKDAFLILDNVERFEDIHLFLPTDKQQYSLLLTSKYFYKTGQRIKQIKLNDFNEKELLDLAKRILGLPFVLINLDKIKKLGRLIGYSPLVSNILIKKIENAPQLLKKYLYHFEKAAKNIYKSPYDYKTLNSSLNLSFAALPKGIKKTFISLGIFTGTDFSIESVAYINNLSNKETRLKLDYLHRFSLLNQSKDELWHLHPLIRIFIKEKIKDKKLYDRLALYYVNYLSELGRGDFSHYEDIEKEIDNILGVFKKCYEIGFYKRLIELWEYLGIFWWDTGNWKTVEKYGQIVCKACLQIKDKYALAKCYIRELCWLHYWQGDITKADKYIKEGMKLANDLGDESLLALSWVRQGKIFQSKKMCDRAFQCFKEALDYYKKEINREKQGDIYTYIGETYWLIKNRERARHYLHQALRVVNKINDLPQKITIISRLGCICLQERQTTPAISYFKKSLLIEKQLGRRVGDTFWNNLALGLTYQILGDFKTAREKFQLAKKEMIFIGFTEQILNVDVFPLIFNKELSKSNFFTTSIDLYRSN